MIPREAIHTPVRLSLSLLDSRGRKNFPKSNFSLHSYLTSLTTTFRSLYSKVEAHTWQVMALVYKHKRHQACRASKHHNGKVRTVKCCGISRLGMCFVKLSCIVLVQYSQRERPWLSKLALKHVWIRDSLHLAEVSIPFEGRRLRLLTVDTCWLFEPSWQTWVRPCRSLVFRLNNHFTDIIISNKGRTTHTRTRCGGMYVMVLPVLYMFVLIALPCGSSSASHCCQF